jgi:hypothetical protein
MKQVMVVAMTLLIVAGIMGPAAAQDRRGPRIEVAEEKFDFGTVTEGSETAHIFSIRNGGDEVLEINKVQSS